MSAVVGCTIRDNVFYNSGHRVRLQRFEAAVRDSIRREWVRLYFDRVRSLDIEPGLMAALSRVNLALIRAFRPPGG